MGDLQNEEAMNKSRYLGRLPSNLNIFSKQLKRIRLFGVILPITNAYFKPFHARINSKCAPLRSKRYK